MFFKTPIVKKKKKKKRTVIGEQVLPNTYIKNINKCEFEMILRVAI